MAETGRFEKATFEIMKQILESDNIEDALAASLDTMIKVLNSEAGAVWLLDKSGERLTPVFHAGPADISNISIENGSGIEGQVTKTGRSVIITDAANDERVGSTVYDDKGLAVQTMLCVPLNDLKKVSGCVQIINKKDGSFYDREELRLCEHMAALAAMTIDEKNFTADLGEDKEVLVKLRDITKDFPSGDGRLQVLKGINLDIYKNEFVVVLGESGCGKSTLMNIVGGMDMLSGGEMTVEGRDFSAPSDAELTKYRRNYVGFVFQQYNLMPNLTALENVEFIAELVDDPMSPEQAIARVKLTDKADSYPGQLSGGQQQRVSIARAIVKKPKLIIADEPTAALDYTTSIEVLGTIGDIVKDHGATVLMVTHNPEIAKMADRVVKLRGGKIASIQKNVRPLSASELVW